METARIRELLQPFIVGLELSEPLLEQLRLYLDLLLRWNARVNLTAVRAPEDIVTRHFGESLFAAQVLASRPGLKSLPSAQQQDAGLKDNSSPGSDSSLADVGSGAGFPGVPIKLVIPHLNLTLIESQNKKATFLRELVRELCLQEAAVYSGRAEQWGQIADVVTLRAVEQFERALPVAAKLVAPAGRLCLLIGAGQVDRARALAGDAWTWAEPVPIPQSAERVVLIARNGSELFAF